MPNLAPLLDNVTLHTRVCAEISQNSSGVCAVLKGGYKVDSIIVTNDNAEESCENNNCGKTTIEWVGQTQPKEGVEPGWIEFTFDDSKDGLVAADEGKDEFYAENLAPVTITNAYRLPRQADNLLKITHEFVPFEGAPTFVAAFGDLGRANEGLDYNEELSTNFIGMKGKLGEAEYEIKVRNLNNWQARVKSDLDMLTGSETETACDILYQRAERNTDKESLKITPCVSLGNGSSASSAITFDLNSGEASGYSLSYENEELEVNLVYTGSAPTDGPEGDAEDGEVSRRLTGSIHYKVDECSKVGLELDSQKLNVCYYRDIKLC